TDRKACIDAFERHNARVRATIPPHRLLEWQPGDGWQPLCTALAVPVPDAPFPRTNTREEWKARHAGAE
ncbi:MAG TPA: sulfotransferase, partial [Candidatus Kryptonia bacterium]|nr:sulfotransferase [Candidatus Kryptonia bacterium]